YRLSLEDRTEFTKDISGIVDVTKLSDPFVMQDFYQSEFRIDPVPDNVVALAKTDPFYTLTAIARFQANDFFEQTERLPEVVLDIKRHALFGSPIFYQGETGFADLHRNFAEGSGFEDYGTTRLDSIHQLLYPYTYFSYVRENGINPAAILQFDRFEPSTQLRPIDFPNFTSIDSIASWTVWRLGLRNRLETRRDDQTVTWLELDTFADVNFDNPYDRRSFSNLFNKLRFNPLPWASLTIDSQIPAFNTGFTEVNTSVAVQPVSNLELGFGHRYLNDNPFFRHSS